MSSNDTQTTTQSATPWGPLAGAYTTGLERAEDLYQQGPLQFFPGQTYVPFSSQTQQALDLTQQRALGGSPVTQAAQQQLTGTLGGDYLQSNPAFGYLEPTASGEMIGQNPYLDAYFDRGADRITDAFMSAQVGGGAGGAYRDQALMQGLGDFATDLYGGAYNQERANQIAAAQSLGNVYAGERENQLRGMLFAPQMANQDYFDIGQLANVGGQYEAQQGLELQDEMNRFAFGQEAPYDQLNRFMAYAQGVPNYQTTVSQQPIYRNQGASILGGALGGASLGNQIGLPPWLGAIGGAGLGLF